MLNTTCYIERRINEELMIYNRYKSFNANYEFFLKKTENKMLFIIVDTIIMQSHLFEYESLCLWNIFSGSLWFSNVEQEFGISLVRTT